MTDLSLTILTETANDAQAIERLHERTFGPGRYVLSAYRLREQIDHILDLSFTARIGTLLVGSVRLLPICIGETRALLLGPLTVEPPFRGRGVGRALIEGCEDWARCPTKLHPTYGKQIRAGKDIWCILPAAKRPAEFAKIDAADFPEPKVMSPPIPGEGAEGSIACPTDPLPFVDPEDLPK